MVGNMFLTIIDALSHPVQRPYDCHNAAGGLWLFNRRLAEHCIQWSHGISLFLIKERRALWISILRKIVGILPESEGGVEDIIVAYISPLCGFKDEQTAIQYFKSVFK